MIPIRERARMVAGYKLPDWLGSLDIHKEKLEAEVERRLKNGQV